MKSSSRVAPLPVAPNLTKDLPNFVLLVCLYMLQGVPLGLTFGAVPFLLKSRLSYSELGLFSLASYPYSIKLAWSPIVDSVYFTSIGRRKSWIIPTQILIGFSMLLLGGSIDEMMNRKELPIALLSLIFFGLVFICATQDIAVDGWALTLLRKENIEYASTAQTIGLNTGYFLSFTVFLALNSPEFCNKFLFSVPQEAGLLTLGSYIQFWGIAFLCVTLWLIFFKVEQPTPPSDINSIKSAYKTIFQLFALPHMKSLIVILMIAKIGFVTNEAITGLKLLEKGFGKEDLALAVLLDFPFQILGGYMAAKWSSGPRPLRPWLFAFPLRLIAAVIGMAAVYLYPSTGVTTSYFIIIMVITTFSSFMATVQFVGLGAFFARISDPVIGGTYMTLLNTLSNFGGTWPRYPVMHLVDSLTTSHCSSTTNTSDAAAVSCHSGAGKDLCKSSCIIDSDGYYLLNSLGVAMGAVILVMYISRRVRNLEMVDISEWKLKKSAE